MSGPVSSTVLPGCVSRPSPPPPPAPLALSLAGVHASARCAGLLTAAQQTMRPFLGCLGSCCGGAATQLVIVDLVISNSEVKVHLVETFMEKLCIQLCCCRVISGFQPLVPHLLSCRNRKT